MSKDRTIKAGTGCTASSTASAADASIRFFLSGYTYYPGNPASCLGVPTDLTMQLVYQYSSGSSGNQVITRIYGLVNPPPTVNAVPEWRSATREGYTPLLHNGEFWNVHDCLPLQTSEDVIDGVRFVKVTSALEYPDVAYFVVQEPTFWITSYSTSGAVPTIETYDVLEPGTKLSVPLVLGYDSNKLRFEDIRYGEIVYKADVNVRTSTTIQAAPADNQLIISRFQNHKTTWSLGMALAPMFSLVN